VDNQHKTRDDARAQLVMHGTMGSLSGECTEEYLFALRQDAFEFIRQIESRLARDSYCRVQRSEADELDIAAQEREES